jgi:hypothetical protein
MWLLADVGYLMFYLSFKFFRVLGFDKDYAICHCPSLMLPFAIYFRVLVPFILLNSCRKLGTGRFQVDLGLSPLLSLD